MKVWISVDMEGIGGIVDREQLLPQGRLYPAARHYMIQEMRVAVEAAWAAGATQVVVNDSHNGMLSLAWEALADLPPETELISGTGKTWAMVEGLAGMDVALLVGYHAMAGTPGAVMDHTYTAELYRLRLNGQEVGECALNAYLAGYWGVPVVLVSGDEALAQEARALLPDAEVVVTKDARGRQSALLLSPALVRQRLYAAVHRALAATARKAPRLVTIAGPVTVEVGLMTTHAADLALLLPGSVRVDGRTVAIETPDMASAFQAFRAFLRLSGGVPLY